MKPNDKAIEAGFNACTTVSRSIVIDILTAAYAAQFPPSKDYAGLIETLRSSSPYTLSHVAADALEAVLAERDALKKALEAEQSTCIKVGNERAAALLERDALLTRLAPVDDKALVEIARQAILKETNGRVGLWPTILVAAIAAIRPHIEAAERERCAKIAEEWSVSVFGDSFDEKHVTEICNSIAPNIAAAIRSGK